jgi:putative transcriptional regulator
MKSKKNKNNQMFDALTESLEEVLAHRQGKITLHTEMVNIHNPPSAYRASDVKRIREKKHCSQSIFATYLNVSVKTVQSWESGQRLPSPIALRLLECLDKDVSPLGLNKKS